MADDVWSNYLLGAQASYNARIQAIADAEKARIEYEEKAEQERLTLLAEQERTRKENEQLRVDAENKEKARIAELEAIQAKANAEQAERERLARVEFVRREKIELEAEAERKRLADELLAQQYAQRQIKEAEEKNLQVELNKGDSAKINDLIADLDSLKTKYVFKSTKNNQMYADVSVLLIKIINHIGEVR